MGAPQRHAELSRQPVVGVAVLPLVAAAAGGDGRDGWLWGLVAVVGVVLLVGVVVGVRHARGVIDRMPVGPRAGDLPPPTREAKICLDLAQRGDDDQLQDYVRRGGQADLTDEQGNTPLMMAAGQGHCAVVRTLVAHGADVNRVNQLGQTPLTRAVLGRRRPVVDMLVRHGANPDRGEPSARDVASRIGRSDLLTTPR